MTSAVKSIVDVSGTNPTLVEIECHISNGLPSILVIGHASKSVDEAKERLRASFANSNLVFPKKRVVINLSPADIPKDSTSLDLAMAVALLLKTKQINEDKISGTMFLGELSLDGSLNPVRGIIGRILAAKKLGYRTFYIPLKSEEQALLVPDIIVKPVSALRDVYLDLTDVMEIKPKINLSSRPKRQPQDNKIVDFSEISDQPVAKRALEIAAAGHHNILLYGPPGTGKTMLAKAVCGILPDLSYEEVLEVTQLHSLGSSNISDIVWARPFRSPHHTASTIALVGGGTNPKPGEATLAHRGVLFLDELPEFAHSALEALRQPLEDGAVTISRVKDRATYPAEFILIATQNPCPCGYYGTSKPCSCSAANIARYEKKISGPILDRIDLHLAVNDIDHSKILGNEPRKKESQPIKQRVATAYAVQAKRFGKSRFNSSMNNAEIRELANLTNEAKELLDTASRKLGLSARAYVRSVKVARTIADLDDEINILPKHTAEALQYRKQVSIT